MKNKITTTLIPLLFAVLLILGIQNAQAAERNSNKKYRPYDHLQPCYNTVFGDELYITYHNEVRKILSTGPALVSAFKQPWKESDSLITILKKSDDVTFVRYTEASTNIWQAVNKSRPQKYYTVPDSEDEPVTETIRPADPTALKDIKVTTVEKDINPEIARLIQTVWMLMLKEERFDYPRPNFEILDPSMVYYFGIAHGSCGRGIPLIPEGKVTLLAGITEELVSYATGETERDKAETTIKKLATKLLKQVCVDRPRQDECKAILKPNKALKQTRH